MQVALKRDTSCFVIVNGEAEVVIIKANTPLDVVDRSTYYYEVALVEHGEYIWLRKDELNII